MLHKASLHPLPPQSFLSSFTRSAVYIVPSKLSSRLMRKKVDARSQPRKNSNNKNSTKAVHVSFLLLLPIFLICCLNKFENSSLIIILEKEILVSILKHVQHSGSNLPPQHPLGNSIGQESSDLFHLVLHPFPISSRQKKKREKSLDLTGRGISRNKNTRRKRKKR